VVVVMPSYLLELQDMQISSQVSVAIATSA